MRNLLITDEVADLVRSKPETVRYWRHVGTGPKYFRIGRRVLYDEGDVLAWIEAQKAQKEAV